MGPVAPQIAGRIAGERIVFDLTPERAGITSVPLRDWYRASSVRRAEAALIILAAGPVAEVRARRTREAYIWALGGGVDDYRQALSIARLWLEGDPENLLDAACFRARTLLRSSRAITATTALADVLQERGWLNGKEIAAICAESFVGPRPDHEAWSECWPPTEAQLREAHIPRLGRIVDRAAPFPRSETPEMFVAGMDTGRPMLSAASRRSLRRRRDDPPAAVCASHPLPPRLDWNWTPTRPAHDGELGAVIWGGLTP